MSRTNLGKVAVILALLAAVVGIAGAAYAGNPHFIGQSSCTQSGSTLICDFKIAGLGNISSATVEVQAPFSCNKTNGGEQFVQPGGLASTSEENVPVTNGQITVTDFVVSGGSCPDSFSATFSGEATVLVNGEVIGTIPIS